MLFLKKTLLFMLVLCTLGYGSAWAYDGHAVDMGNDAPVVIDMLTAAITLHPLSDETGGFVSDQSSATSSGHPSDQSSVQSSEQSSSADVDCDHCGHISAHLQVVFPRNGYMCSVNQSSELLEFSEDFTSFIISPDLRPPRV